MDNTTQELNSACAKWNRQMRLLQQVSSRLLECSGDFEIYEWNIVQTRRCLTEMQKLAVDFPAHAPYGEGFENALSCLRTCLSSLQESLKVMGQAKQAATVAASEASWGRVLEESQRRR
jgi:hypothetical protein